MRALIKVLIILIFYSGAGAAEAEVPKNSLPPSSLSDKPNDLRIRSSYILVNHDLDGSGFKNSNTSKLGSGYEFSYTMSTIKGPFRFVWSSLDAEYDTSTGLSPNKIKAHINRISADIKLSEQGGVGLEHRERKSQITTPNQMLPKTQMLSIRPFYSKSFKIDESLKLDFEAGFLIPLLHYEKGDKTGSISWVFAPDIEVLFVYKVNPLIDAAFGFEFLYETSHYSGSGDRGTSHAKETFIHTHIPFELRFRF